MVAAGRRWGKTVMCGSVAVAYAAHGASVAWIAPTYKNSRPLWRFAERVCAGAARIHRAERLITFPNGGALAVYSADSPDSIRSEAFHLVVIDEAARVEEEAWTDAIQPTLADYNGKAILISTPRGRNWFYREYMKADGKNIAAFHAPSCNNPNPNIKAAYEKARNCVSARTFAEEWDAQFVDDGALFANIYDLAAAEPQSHAVAGHVYVIGVDWARASGGDFTVYAVVDATESACVRVERYSGLDFATQRDKLADLCRRFNNAHIIAEYNSIGGPQVEALQSSGLPVSAFTTTAAAKHQIISALELAFDKRDIRIVNDQALVRELSVFERKDRAGLPAYKAPSGEHDDCVIALALAWWGARGLDSSTIAEAIL